MLALPPGYHVDNLAERGKEGLGRVDNHPACPANLNITSLPALNRGKWKSMGQTSSTSHDYYIGWE